MIPNTPELWPLSVSSLGKSSAMAMELARMSTRGLVQIVDHAQPVLVGLRPYDDLEAEDHSVLD